MKEIYVDTTSKKFMFQLGVLFASGEQIKILNMEEVNQKIEAELIEFEEKIKNNQDKNNPIYIKSYNMMIKFWQDNKLSPKYNVKTDPNKVFLICPVRKATEEEKAKLNAIVTEYKENGYQIHYPDRDTVQDPVVNGINTGGYSICLDNTIASAKANTTVVFYNKTSTGSMFDLGAVYYLKTLDPSRKFVLANEIELDSNDYIDQRVAELLSENKIDYTSEL